MKVCGQYLTILALSVNWPINAFFDRSVDALSVTYTLLIRFVHYTSVTCTAMSVS